ncbi:MAG: lytic transglycosylase domain-containing protein [Christensenella sp.]|nr:lytic transglycosylase domain-containing protein [Christensenella sp.]
MMGRTGRPKNNGKKIVIAVICIAVAVCAVFGALYITGNLETKADYPLDYEDLILKYANEYELDPYFVAAVIKTESGFRPDAESGAGAIGLMQIMPETGQWASEKIGMENFTSDMLFDPETNIRLGCWYLSFLKERFSGDLPIMMAAYNAGHNKVQQWLENPEYSSDGKQLTNIPYEETDNYVKKVTKAYEKYKEYYEMG